jgi:DNA processing protein
MLSAHKGALNSARGTTMGVLGGGLEVVHPKENRKGFERIEQRGAMLSEFPIGTFPAPQNFPIATGSWPASRSGLWWQMARSILVP